MRKIKSEIITMAVEELCALANYELPNDVLSALKAAHKKENVPAKNVLAQIIKNARIAKDEKIPLCQDTGTANFFIDLGRGVQIEGLNLYDAVNKGVSLGYKNNYLRKSILCDPLIRKNTGDNTPANVYVNFSDDDNIKITFLPKGGGSENASALKMLNPSQSWEGIKNFILQTVKEKGANACPPLIIGVAIGGDFSCAAKNAKAALLRKIGSKNKNPFYAKKEKELLKEINKLAIGPMGIGGKTTALAVFIDAKPRHIASLPAAVSIQCHSHRHKTIVL
ncbi:MAG: fumarate hydratase [Endomicrobium sp.]|jgi:fumarate hydratase subunit alpha|nr:fumarate hydratase [Endomicrobium sp.]